MLDDREALFRALIEDHGSHPRHGDPLEPADARADGHNPLCGDRVALAVRLSADTITACSCRARGCAICTASGSLLTDLVRGLRRAEAVALIEAFRAACVSGNPLAATPYLGEAQRETLDALAIIHSSPLRVKCVTLPWHALNAALTGASERTHDLRVAPAGEAPA